MIVTNMSQILFGKHLVAFCFYSLYHRAVIVGLMIFFPQTPYTSLWPFSLKIPRQMRIHVAPLHSGLVFPFALKGVCCHESIF